jgi:FkbH-like protein
MKDFNSLKKNLKKDFSGLKKIRLALLGDSSTQLLNQAIRGFGFEEGYDLQIWEADFDQVELQVHSFGSELYASTPEMIILYRSSHQLLNRYNKLPIEQRLHLADNEMRDITSMCQSIRANTKASIIYFNYAEIDDSIYGNFTAKNPSSFLYQLRKLNYELMQFAGAHTDVNICDISSIQNKLGRNAMFSPSIYVNTEMLLSVDALPYVAQRTVSIIGSLSGKMKKCLILDLDNTLWGGIIGDDGIENIQLGSLGIGKSFTEFQYWIKKLRQRGVILAVCSKNDDPVARKPFTDHPDMVLKLDDVAVFVANWKNKVDNIYYIQSVLNIGFDSMVFLDDNPFERNMVRENIQGIIVPELPEDPAHYLEYLYQLNLFETISVSEEDLTRTQLYQTDALRVEAQNSFANEADFLKSLNMASEVEPFNEFNSPRVVQLSQRSNQFNLRTVRYTPADIEQIKNSDSFFNFTFTLNDKFGENGLICVVSVKREDKDTAFIENWFMSCRVLKRGMEEFVLNTVVDHLRKHHFKNLKGEYIPTAKNGMVKDHYKKLGFSQNGEFWDLAIDNYSPKQTFIKKAN